MAINWNYNEEMQVWEGQSGNWRATIQPDVDQTVYTATIVPPPDAKPMDIAPQAFDQLDAARQWCEEEIAQRSQYRS
jgi:hypothetical protein